jgi:hypothetical protein
MFQKMLLGLCVMLGIPAFVGCGDNYYWYGTDEATAAKEAEAKLGDAAPIVRMTEANATTADELYEKASELAELADKMRDQQSETRDSLAAHFESENEKLVLYASEMDALASFVEGKVLTSEETRLVNRAMTKQGLSMVDLKAVGFARDKNTKPTNEALAYASQLRAAARELRAEEAQPVVAAAPAPAPVRPVAPVAEAVRPQQPSRAAIEAAKAELILEAATQRHAMPAITEVGPAPQPEPQPKLQLDPAPESDSDVKGVIVSEEKAREEGLIEPAPKPAIETPSLDEAMPSETPSVEEGIETELPNLS